MVRTSETRPIIHPPHFGPCMHTFRSDDLIPPFGWEESGAEVRNEEGARGGALFSNGQSGWGFGGWGSRFSFSQHMIARINYNSALCDCALSLRIGASGSCLLIFARVPLSAGHCGFSLKVGSLMLASLRPSASCRQAADIAVGARGLNHAKRAWLSRLCRRPPKHTDV